MATRDVARGEGGLLDQGQAVVAAVENVLAVVCREDDDACRRAGEMRARCGRDVGEMWARCGRDSHPAACEYLVERDRLRAPRVRTLGLGLEQGLEQAPRGPEQRAAGAAAHGEQGAAAQGAAAHQS